MESLTKLAYLHMTNEFYLSALLILQAKQLSGPLDYYIAAKSLHGLGHHKKIQDIIEQHPELLKYHEINLLSIRSGKDVSTEPSMNIKVPAYAGIEFSARSLRYFCIAMNKKEKIRKKHLIMAFQEDTRNIEALVFLLKESLCTQEELLAIINGAEQIARDEACGQAGEECCDVAQQHRSEEDVSFRAGPSDRHAFSSTAKYCEGTQCAWPSEYLGLQISGQLIDNFDQNINFSNQNINKNRESANHGCELERKKPKADHEKYRSFLLGLFKNEDFKEILCPLTIHLEAMRLFRNSQFKELFRRAVRHKEHFPESEFVYEALGLYYLSKRHCKDARRCFFKAIEISRFFGNAYLCCGVVQSMLRETESAVSMLNMAFAIMNASCLPAYYLALEYQQMNNFSKAKYYYKHCIEQISQRGAAPDSETRFCEKKNRTEGLAGGLSAADAAIINGAIYCLVYNEDYEEAMGYIKAFGVDNLLNVYCLLFMGAFEEAREAMATCEKDSFYHATKGYLLHLVDDFDNAVREYEKCLVGTRMQVVESLMKMALDNVAGTEANHAFDYSNCMFDALEYKKWNLFLADV